MLVTKHVLLASTVHATPYFIVRGMMPGPVMFITSGVHGNETASMAAAQNSQMILRQVVTPFSEGC